MNSHTPPTSSPARLNKPGLVYFLALNSDLADADLARQIDALAAAGISAIVLHPRSGLELPYGGDDWFDRIEWICDRCEARNLDVWLYDEDPYPSGAAGGRKPAVNRPALRAKILSLTLGTNAP